MLILSRRPGEEIEIGGDANGGHTLFDRHGNPAPVTVTVLGVEGNRVRVGISAPKNVPVHREEVFERIKRGLAGGEVTGNVQDEPAPPRPKGHGVGCMCVACKNMKAEIRS